ncbi:Hypothetical protein FKW44_007728 [Caligus rogercresseyi]|uniref:Uncharacterized protein n=1 Tax=Caligus rogercresseyi TaxID=217165 RepID=A0A7T8QTS5_CALRO|nr:Hypothetical protein FKW44_007728 [Caligus rogercresseyi]
MEEEELLRERTGSSHPRSCFRRRREQAPRVLYWGSEPSGIVPRTGLPREGPWESLETRRRVPADTSPGVPTRLRGGSLSSSTTGIRRHTEYPIGGGGGGVAPRLPLLLPCVSERLSAEGSSDKMREIT